MTTEQQKADAELLFRLSKQVEEVVNTLMLLRKPEMSYEIMRAVDSSRQILHWVADGYGQIKVIATKQ